MKKLFILHDFPYPDIDGGKKITLGRILEAAKNYKVVVLIYNYHNSNNYNNAINFFDEYNIEYIIYEPKNYISKSIKFTIFFRKYCSLNPYYYEKIYTKDFYNFIVKQIAILRPQCISIESIFISSILQKEVIKKCSNIEILFHNVESNFYKELSKSTKNLKMKIFYIFEYFKIKTLEKRLSRDMKIYKNIIPVYLSNEDKKYYEKNCSFPTDSGIMNKNYIFIQEVAKHTPDINYPYFLFPGSLLFPPNYKAIKHIVDNYRINAKILITGKINDDIKKDFLKYEFVIFTGLVSEVKLNEYYKNCICVISPIISGGGIKIKNIETAMRGIPIIMTKFSSIGFPQTIFNKFIITENDSKSFLYALEVFFKNSLVKND